MKVLLSPDNVGGGDSASSMETQTPTFVPQQATSVQIESLKSKPAAPIQVQDKPIPDSVKGTSFDIDDGEKLGDFEDNKDAAPKSDFTITKTERKNETPNSSDEKPAQQLEKKVDVKQKEEAAKPKDENKSPVQQQQQVKKEVEARDYSVFPEEIRDELKKTSNGAFNYIKDVYTKHKELESNHEKLGAEVKKIQEGGLPFSYYENPEAWRLHPHGSQLLNKASRIDYEEGFYREQLDRIVNGEKFFTIRGYDKNGNPVFDAEQEPSDAAKNNILLAIGQLSNAKVAAYTQVNGFAQQFKGQMQQQAQKVNEIIDNEFPWHKDPNDEHQQWVKEFSGVVPDERQGDYMSKVASLLYAKWQKTLSLLEEASGMKRNEEIATETKNRIEPAVKSPSISGAQKSGVAVSANGKYQPPQKFDVEGL
jgi:hypothetical protein